jgi:hypothetical protein
MEGVFIGGFPTIYVVCELFIRDPYSNTSFYYCEINTIFTGRGGVQTKYIILFAILK